MCIRKNLKIVVGFKVSVYFAYPARVILLSLRKICISGCILKYCFRVHLLHAIF